MTDHRFTPVWVWETAPPAGGHEVKICVQPHGVDLPRTCHATPFPSGTCAGPTGRSPHRPRPAAKPGGGQRPGDAGLHGGGRGGQRCHLPHRGRPSSAASRAERGAGSSENTFFSNCIQCAFYMSRLFVKKRKSICTKNPKIALTVIWGEGRGRKFFRGSTPRTEGVRVSGGGRMNRVRGGSPPPPPGTVKIHPFLPFAISLGKHVSHLEGRGCSWVC